MASHQVDSERYTGAPKWGTALQLEVASVLTACVSLTLYLRVITRRKKMEKECAVIHCTNTDLVYSGTDALQLGGIPTETYCRPCAIAYTVIKQEQKERFGV